MGPFCEFSIPELPTTTASCWKQHYGAPLHNHTCRSKTGHSTKIQPPYLLPLQPWRRPPRDWHNLEVDRSTVRLTADLHERLLSARSRRSQPTANDQECPQMQVLIA